MTSERNPAGWLPNVGPFTVQVDGVELPRRGTINYVESTDSGGPEDDPDNDRTNVPKGSPGGGNANGKANRTAASNYAGADLGAKILAAQTALLLIGGGVVEVEDTTTPYSLSTQVIVESGIAISLGAGDIELHTTSNAFRMKDHTAIYGVGFATRIIESDNADPNALAVIAGYNDASSGADGNTDVRVANLQIVGNAPAIGSAAGTIAFGNAHEVVIEGVKLSGTRTIGIAIGGAPSSGFHASDIWIRHCRFDQVASQNVAVVNGKRWHIDNNTFSNASQLGSGNASYIDCETNDSDDILEAWTITGNIIDARGSIVPGNGILVQGCPRARGGIIADNTIIGGDYTPDVTQSFLVVPIFLTTVEDTLIANNNILYAGSGISISNCNRVTFRGNRVTDVGGVDIHCLNLDDCTHCVVAGNTFHATPNAGCGNRITETGSSDYNTFTNNSISQLRDDYTQTSQDPKIILVGANSRAFANDFRGSLVGRGTPQSVAELRLFPTPWAGTTDPSPVQVDGYRKTGDGGHATFKWNDLSIVDDNGLTVVKPTNLDVGLTGRWERGHERPRLKTAQRDALTLGPADAPLTIWNRSEGSLQMWNGLTWVDIYTGAGDPFKPQDAVDCEAWWDTRVMTLGGGLPTLITNQAASGADRNLDTATGTGASVASDPTYDDESVVTFDGSGFGIENNGDFAASIAQPFRLYIVCEFHDAAARVLFDKSPAAAGGHVSLLSSTNGADHVVDLTASASNDFQAAPLPLATPIVLCLVVDGGTTTAYINDPATALTVESGFDDPGANALASLMLGQDSAGANPMWGKWAALGVFSGAGDITERTAMFAGLKDRYGL